MTKSPSVSERAVREKPVPTWRAVTLAFATEAPSGSVILPAMLPRPCACEETATKRIARRTNKTCFFISAYPFEACRKRKPGLPDERPSSAAVLDEMAAHNTPELNRTKNSPDDYIWPIVTISLLNRCIGRDIRSARAVSQSGNSKAVL